MQNMDRDDDERGLDWEHEVRDIQWLDDDDDDGDGDEEKRMLSSKRPVQRSGHVAVTDGTCMFVWGGYKNAEADDLYLPKEEIWIYNMETARWRMKCSYGDVPDSMSGSCGTCVDGVLYLFGGHHARGNTNSVYRLPLRSRTFCWEKMTDLKGLAPTSKDKLGCWVYKNKLVYFGGYGYAAPPGHRGTFEFDENPYMGNHVGRGWNNHIHILDLETLTWSQRITKGNAPSPRAAHACATLDNRGFVFGGRYMDHRLNDLYYINLDTWTWSEICFPQHGPTGRSWHSLTPVSPDHLFLFGGFTTNRETLSDAWIYCVNKNEWKPFNHEHAGRPRLWHTACSGHDGEVFVFGGCANDLSHGLAAHSNDLLVFSVLPKSLLRLCLDAAVQYRKQTKHMWDVLPKHLLLQLKQNHWRCLKIKQEQNLSVTLHDENLYFIL